MMVRIGANIIHQRLFKVLSGVLSLNKTDSRENASEAEESTTSHMKSFKKTANSMLWTYSNLKLFVVHDQAVNFILDCDFMHYSTLEKCVEFINETYHQLNSTDYFGLTSLGDQIFTINLEKKSLNDQVKSSILSHLNTSIEDVLMNDREVSFKVAMIEAIERFEQVVPIRHVQYGGRDF